MTTAPALSSAEINAHRLPRVYVAGPYTQDDVMQNIRQAILASDWLADQDCVPFVPHLTGFWHLVSPHPYEFWLQMDLAWVKVCDALVRLPGPSQGADGEVVQARAWGLPVFEAGWEGEAVFVRGFLDWLREWHHG